MAALYDLETEVEVIQEQLMELLSSFTAHWAIRAVVTGIITAEFYDLVYVKLQADWKIFHIDPISFEVQMPDWLSGESARIRELGLEECEGFYFNFLALPMRLTLDINVKHCEGSLRDWATGNGVDGPGLHIYCRYLEGNEIALL